MTDSQVRVRFAPSPTGYLHIGGARTAIFNWLLARKHAGKFLLRIEDTDQARSGEEMVSVILDGLTWLGLEWDEPPVYQSQRFPIYRGFAEQLVATGHAYYCFCSQERLQELRERAIAEKRTPKYDGRCKALSAEERAELEAGGSPRVIRFKTPSGDTTFKDEVHGELVFENAEIDDFIILRSDGIPTYHLAVVVDDHDMGITHVIRGDDHLTNTPKQVLLYHAFGWELPAFAHVPLILGPDKRRLSKRHGATSVGEYRKAGYLPEAMLNYLALLGWSPGDDREIMSLDELIEAFSLAGISKKSAVFDERKLEWMNSQYIQRLSGAQLVDRASPFLLESGLISAEELAEKKEYLTRVAELVKTRIRRLTEFADAIVYFMRDPEEYDEQAVAKHWKAEETVERLQLIYERLETLPEFDESHIEETIRGLAEELGVSAAKLIHPTRLAVTGRAATPGLFEVMTLLGRDTVLRRIKKAVEFMKKS
jgi:glutamyl-tRNA synthetase